MSSKSSHYHATLKVMLSAASNVKKINEARQRDGQEEVVKKEDDDPQLFGEAKKCHYVLNRNVRPSDWKIG